MLPNFLKDAYVRLVLILFLGSGAGLFSAYGQSESPSEVYQKFTEALNQGDYNTAKEYVNPKIAEKWESKLEKMKVPPDLNEDYSRKEFFAVALAHVKFPSDINVKSKEMRKNEVTLKVTGKLGWDHTPEGRDFPEQDDQVTALINFTSEEDDWKFAGVDQIQRRVVSQEVDQKDLIKKCYSPGEFKILPELNLSHSDITDEGLKYVQDLADLYRLSLDNTDITDKGLQYLQGLDNLQKLDLGDTEITDDGLKYLKGLGKLKMLDFRDTNVTGEGLKHLQDLGNLQDLGLRDTEITDNGLMYLENLDKLQKLNLGDTDITGEGLKHLQGLDNLQKLNLSDTNTRDEGLKYLQDLMKLELVDLTNTNITDEGIQYLQGLGKLKNLDLDNTDLTDKGLKYLQDLANLQKLDLGNTNITDDGLKYLEGLGKLKMLNLKNTEVTDARLYLIEEFSREFACRPPLEEKGWPNGMADTEVRFIRLEYRGGDWDQDMGKLADYNFLVKFGDLTGFKIAQNTDSIPIADLSQFPEGKAPPFVFITGSNGINVTTREIKILQEYLLERGGMLFADNGGGHFDQSFRQLMRRVLPDHVFEDIPNDDVIYRRPYRFPYGAPALWHHSGKRALGIKHNGRWVVFYHQGDINDAWKAGHGGAEKLAPQAYRLGVNVVNYAFHQYMSIHSDD